MIKTWQQRCDEYPDHQQGIVTQQMIQDRMQEEIDELRQALAQPEQEPVAWITPDGEGFRIRFSPPVNDMPLGWEPLYTAPPKREWVGLTYEEARAIRLKVGSAADEYAVAIEEALKEKNGGNQ